MAELFASDRLQPCLLDRLTDDDPQHQQESRQQRVMSAGAFKAAVLRDLEWLLNTGSRESTGDYDEFEEVRTSVLNYGVRDFSGLNVYTMLLPDLQKAVAEAIRRYEPRIIADRLRVFILTDEDGYDAVAYQTCAIGIESLLWNLPMPEELFAKTEVDLETGACKVVEGGR